jgi:hypothetical protein
MVFRGFEEADFAALAQFESSFYQDARPTLRAVPAGLRFFSRSGHSFLAQAPEDNTVQGFVLAQALWQGDQVTVLITRLLATPGAYQGLLAAVVKSAYDAGVYEIALHLDTQNQDLTRALQENGFTVGPLVLAVRLLGSRGQIGEAAGVLI